MEQLWPASPTTIAILIVALGVSQTHDLQRGGESGYRIHDVADVGADVATDPERQGLRSTCRTPSMGSSATETPQRDFYADDASIAVGFESCSRAEGPVFRGLRPQSGYSSGKLITIASWVLRAITTSARVVGSGFSSRCGRYGGTKT